LRAVGEAIERAERLRHLGPRRRRSTNVATASASASGPLPLAPVSQHPPGFVVGGTSLKVSASIGQLYDADGLQPSCAQTLHHIIVVAQVIACAVSAPHATGSVRSW